MRRQRVRSFFPKIDEGQRIRSASGTQPGRDGTTTQMDDSTRKKPLGRDEKGTQLICSWVGHVDGEYVRVAIEPQTGTQRNRFHKACRSSNIFESRFPPLHSALD